MCQKQTSLSSGSGLLNYASLKSKSFQNHVKIMSFTVGNVMGARGDKHSDSRPLHDDKEVLFLTQKPLFSAPPFFSIIYNNISYYI